MSSRLEIINCLLSFLHGVGCTASEAPSCAGEPAPWLLPWPLLRVRQPWLRVQGGRIEDLRCGAGCGAGSERPLGAPCRGCCCSSPPVVPAFFSPRG